MRRGLKFWVDWGDKSFPRIRVWRFHGIPESESPDPQTLAQAKREIVEHFQHMVEFGRDRVRETRQLRLEDIIQEDGS